jgi:hypothetical protein
MSECQFCRAETPSTITFLGDRYLAQNKEPPSVARFHTEPPQEPEQLDFIEVGPCCEKPARAELSGLRERLLTLAADPQTEAPWLLVIGNIYQRESAFREALVQNPNIPSVMANLLAPLYFDELLANPSFALWCLESPHFLQDLEGFFLRRIKDLGERRWSFPCSESWLRHLSLSVNPRARCYAASHENTPKDLARQLAHDPRPEVRRFLTYHADEELLLELARDLDVEVRQCAARFGLHMKALALLSCDPAHEVRASVAHNTRVVIPSHLRIGLRFELNTEERHVQ